jgi:hypothetical protein
VLLLPQLALSGNGLFKTLNRKEVNAVMKFLVLILIVLVLCMVAAVAIFHFFGVPGLLGLLVAMAIGLWLGVKLIVRAFKAAFTAPFKMKGKVLHDASTDVHSVAPTAQPEPKKNEWDDDEEEDDEDEDEDDEDEDFLKPEEDYARRRWFTVDVTISPNAAAGSETPFALWEPGELDLVGPDVDPENLFGDDDDDDDNLCVIHHFEVWREDKWVSGDDESLYDHDDEDEDDEDEDDEDDYLDKIGGAQRLRFTVGVLPAASKLQFQYYFELFGGIDIPA